MIKTDQKTPTEPGQYIWRNCNGIQIIEVYLKPARCAFGSSFDPYLAVTHTGGGAVSKLAGTFSKRLIVTDDGSITDHE